MVSLDELGLQVKVFVNNSPATEYPDEEPGAVSDRFEDAIPRSHKWIQCMDGAQFAIQVEAKPDAVDNWLSKGARDAFCFHIAIDGKQSVAKGTIKRHRLSDMITGARGLQQQTDDHQEFSVHLYDYRYGA